jgi:2-oxoglutarate dehydrogenase E1 component
VIIDQFITSAHDKWQRMSGLVMLLPHGYEGQGPEHSSARVERYLQACADDNIQVVNCSTPAQYFHVLRRQMSRRFRTPLVIFTPKSLLRLPRAMSRPEDLSRGGFESVIGDAEAAVRPGAVDRLVLCSGKVYYDLLEERRRRHGDAELPVAIVRVEQLYPWPAEWIAEELARYPEARDLVWCQEEPSNMGAYLFVAERLRALMGEDRRLHYAGRPESASPAVGSARIHKREQAALLADALGLERSEPTQS